MINNTPIKQTVLIVDDESSNIDLLGGILKEDYDIKVALNGEKAIKIAESQNSPDLILLDIIMPDMDGYHVCKQLKGKEKTREIPIIFITAKSEVQDETYGLDLGAVDYLTKPISPSIVKARVKTHLQLAESRAQLETLLSKTLLGSIKLLSDLLAMVRPQVFSQVARLKVLAKTICESLALPEIWRFELAALLSHIGCVILPRDLIEKVYRRKFLTPKEEELFQSHPEIGHDLLKNIPRLENIAEMIRLQNAILEDEIPNCHPREWDEVTLGGQILKLVIDFDKYISNDETCYSALAKMKKKKGHYSIILLAVLEKSLTKKVDIKVRSVNVSSLREGMILIEDVLSQSGMTLASKGSEISRHLIHILNRFDKRDNLRTPILVQIPEE